MEQSRIADIGGGTGGQTMILAKHIQGAIYNISIERGLNEWRKFLKTGRYITVSESAWFTDKRLAEIHDFWMGLYSEIDTMQEISDYVEARHFSTSEHEKRKKKKSLSKPIKKGVTKACITKLLQHLSSM